MDKKLLLGTSKIGSGNKITLIKKAKDFLRAKNGDLIAFYLTHDNEIVIKKIDLSEL